uniref:Uncharacterized protein n=1 Tax=Anguilla anguilla TaxID=7936 RepID=A0A0E9VF32_ANGAN
MRGVRVRGGWRVANSVGGCPNFNFGTSGASAQGSRKCWDCHK